MGCVVLEIFFVILDNFSEGVFGSVTIGESNLVENGSALVLFRIPTSYKAVEGAVAGEIALNG